jgi:hypothetical protein
MELHREVYQDMQKKAKQPKNSASSVPFDHPNNPDVIPINTSTNVFVFTSH